MQPTRTRTLYVLSDRDNEILKSRRVAGCISQEEAADQVLSIVNQKDLYQFQATRFVSNSLWRQWWHMLSEVLEVGWALLLGDLQAAARETIDVRQSSETMNRIQAGLGADIEMAMEHVITGCEERGYYDEQ